jgi:antitoxin (DNA-binding transcriptional repressor) of toxin-antitoxin stability system
MRYLNIREMRSLLGELGELVEEQQELIITRNKKEIARILPVLTKRKRPSHAQLRQLTQPGEISSTAMIRQDRNER